MMEKNNYPNASGHEKRAVEEKPNIVDMTLELDKKQKEERAKKEVTAK